MITLSIPQYISDILQKLETHGHLAYLVGGCVRDLLLSRFPNDWDICTSALPEQVLTIFPDAIPTGLQHGTVTVKGGQHQLAEVTTFRTETTYSDHRRPDQVQYISDLAGDLSRRDFTMNAIALAKDGSLIDPFGGQRDIQQGCIRCVREPDVRFQEDALRMFRALRFSATLGFSIEPKTLAAITRHASLTSFLAAERIREELEKTLCSPHPQVVSEILHFGLLNHLLAVPHPQLDFAALAQLSTDRLLRWAGFCARLQAADCIVSAEQFLTALRLDSATVRACSCGLIAQQSMPLVSALDCKRLLAAVGQSAAYCAAAAALTLSGTDTLEQLSQILASGDCCSLKALAITGHDLTALGLKGLAIGTMLARLLDYVLMHPEKNELKQLIALAQSLQKEDSAL